jgi:hypothetical protein
MCSVCASQVQRLALSEEPVTYASVHEHHFVQAILSESAGVGRASGFNPLRDDDYPPLDELQFYIVRVGYAVAHTLTWVEQLHHAVLFIGNFGYGRQLRDAGVNRSHHLIFNVENYLVRLQSVYDRLLQLTNAVFHICMSDELVNHSLIVSNLHVARTKVPQLLKAVRKTIQGKAEDRNAIVHKHSYMDPKLRRLELLYMHTEETWRPERSEMTYRNLCHARSQQMREVTSAKKEEFRKINTALVAALLPLLTELHAQYETRKKRLAA